MIYMCKYCDCKPTDVIVDCSCECHDTPLRAHGSTMVRVSEYLDKVESMLERKNIKYKDSCYNPARIFSKSNPIEQLKVRIDDKLSRISGEGTGESPFSDLVRILVRVADGHVDDEDTVMDLIGYLVLLACAPNGKDNE